MREYLVKKLGGFTDIEEYLDNVSDFKEKNYILTRAVKKLFNVVGADDILKVHDNGQWMFQGRPLSNGERDLLIAEAQMFMESKLWEILQADIKYQANRKMFLVAEDAMQVTGGKLWMYTLDAFKTRLESMRQGVGIFNAKAKKG